MILLAVIFAGSVVWASVLILRNRREAAFYSETQQSYVQIVQSSPPAAEPDVPSVSGTGEETQPSKADALQISVDFADLQAAGKDVAAWLYVPGTNISYPVVQGPDNHTYERHDYTGTYAWAGSIFMDYRCASDFSGKSTVLYGHNIKNDTMFSQLSKFRDGTFTADHPNFYVITPEGQQKYEVFSVRLAEANDPIYTFSFADDAAFSNYLNLLRSDALISCEAVSVGQNDRIVLLSTCTNRVKTERLVVAGRLVSQDQA